MKKKIIILVLFLLFLPAVCLAGDSDQLIEKKKEAIINIMSKGQFKAYIQDDSKFCTTFLTDFKQQKEIEHINPITEAYDYNDAKLQEYFKQCPNKKFNKNVEISHARTLQEIAGREQSLGRPLTEGELEEYGGIEFYATKNFKLYKVNLDNINNNSAVFVFYAEGYYNNVIKRYTYGGYVIIDLKKCKRISGVSTRDPFDYNKQQPIENYNGIIRYKDEYYVYDLYKDKTQRLTLAKYNKKRGNMNSICQYRLQK